MPDSTINSWSILDHETMPRQHTLLDEILFHSSMTYVSVLECALQDNAKEEGP
jgi:hypothetical protein